MTDWEGWECEPHGRLWDRERIVNCELGTSCKLALAGVDIPKSPLGQMKYLKELGF